MDEVLAPDPPTAMSEAALAEWDYIVPKLLRRRTLSEADRGLLAMMCIEYAEYMEAVEELKVLKESKQPFKGCIVDHPRVRMRASYERYSKSAMQFGLSPASKARVQATEKPLEKPKPNDGPRILKIAQ
ncbi:MAG TPA: phage terminase small subunit P27 family [Prosthecobacter sp.]|nr:phage terminase small subunit P27 family [Prosthecobacter sp.]